MLLTDAITMADTLCPNAYSLEEKLRWCDEVTAGIRRDIKKIYTTWETTVTPNEELHLPEHIAFADIDSATLNGVYLGKVDVRSLLAGKHPLSHSGGTLRLAVLKQPVPVRHHCIRGEFDLSENFIRITAPPFEVGDTLEWVALSSKEEEPDWENANSCYVIDAVYDGLVVDRDAFVPQTAAPLAIRRVIDDCTEVDEAPYDSMYVEYLLAKMALYQRDYAAYSAHMTQYNTLYEGLRRSAQSLHHPTNLLVTQKEESLCFCRL